MDRLRHPGPDPLWYAPPPQRRLDGDLAASQWSEAQKTGLEPLSRARIDQARAEGGPPLSAVDRSELIDTMRPVLERFGLGS